ncbi:MAG: hypothetical protein JWM80_4904 [Cyanobacteria bacterium RYN_339]|nr:hypothetical protein [Cyanobacteria bacterium RYN_339]
MNESVKSWQALKICADWSVFAVQTTMPVVVGTIVLLLVGCTNPLGQRPFEMTVEPQGACIGDAVDVKITRWKGGPDETVSLSLSRTTAPSYDAVGQPVLLGTSSTRVDNTFHIHFTLAKTMTSPDGSASLDMSPGGTYALVVDLRSAGKSIAGGSSGFTPCALSSPSSGTVLAPGAMPPSGPGPSAATTVTASERPPALTMAGLTFRPPSVEAMQAIGGTPYVVTMELRLPIRPSFSAPISEAPKIESGNYALESSFPNPFGDGWAVASVLAATADPIVGTKNVDATILPRVRNWADDGTLFTGYQRLPNLGDQRAGIVRSNDPKETMNEDAIIQHVGWPLTYVSASRHEALYFFAGGQVLNVRWGLQRFTELTVPVSKQAAIATVVAALRDAAATSEEARTGLDHYLGVPFAGVFPPNAVNYHDDLVPTFDVPDAVEWSAFLGNDFVDKPTWYVQGSWGGGGLVDAVSGALIRFTRLRVGHGTGGPPSPFTPPQPQANR